MDRCLVLTEQVEQGLPDLTGTSGAGREREPAGFEREEAVVGCKIESLPGLLIRSLRVHEWSNRSSGWKDRLEPGRRETRRAVAGSTTSVVGETGRCQDWKN
jgi:hypothetical protein